MVKSSATDLVKAAAVKDIESVLNLGWSRGQMIYQVFGNLASKPVNDPDWGGTAKQFQNQLTVARYFSEIMSDPSTDISRLQGIIAAVGPDTNVSSEVVIAQLIGQPPSGP